jgi:uncharacterized protein DUF2752
VTATAPPPVARDVERSRWDRVRTPTLVIGGLAAFTLALHLRDPHQHASWGLCPSAAMGFYCPGCGGLRAVNDLTNGDVAAAASSNLLFIAVLPVAVFLLGRWFLDRWAGRHREPNGRMVVVAAVASGVLAVGFAVLRNLPAGSWLAP